VNHIVQIQVVDS